MSESNLNTAVEGTPNICYGGLVWCKTDREESDEYESSHPLVGNFRIYLYNSGYHQGVWFWHVTFNNSFTPGYVPSVLSMSVGDIVESREAAMLACMDAKARFLDDLKRLAVVTGLNDYTTGFTDGEKALAEKIAAVLP